FGTEAALVRQQMISGTHAIALALFGNLLPGDELLTVGLPYDTLLKVIGYNEKGMGTLKELGINFRYVDFDFENFDPQQVLRAVSNTTKIISI
ncbi:MAG: methionine gamma-lyase family protein, partial [Clostridiales bacterium]